MFWQHDSRSQARTIGTTFTLANPIEPIAGRDDPSIRWRPVHILAEVLEDGGMFRGSCGKIIESFVDSRCQTRCCYVMAEYALVRHLRKKTRLRDQLTK